ncbi:ATP-dependent DNA helicase Q1 isoform X1 [Erpetoichthys calabaricus]|uniref:ATP-dependent DNA helicase n=1 Tax=Erpetoichthys calabaricus TaxID=27687 RepID=A0A8C4S6Z0_ERPCA|nr:ATP-dependent DNA helicase Q1 isoform X1 [Erpetoichthys calabaricus]
MADIAEIKKELDSINSELTALELQISDLEERRNELIAYKSRLKKKLDQTLKENDGASSSKEELDLQIYKKKDFPWSQKIQSALVDVFKLSNFRPLQLQTINITMSRKDIFLIMPTGGGKSLCYQLPAVCSDGFTLVIAPLVSLMEDQIMFLEKLGISAATLNASSSKEHAKWVQNAMLNKSSDFKLLYVTPEKISKSKLFMSKLEKAYHLGRLSRIAVDEVHCCSQWGHDFRPDYKVLGILKRQFPNVPVIGLTATATSSVLKDCQKILCLDKVITLTASFNRPNLYYEVRQKPSSSEDFTEDIVRLINQRYKNQSGIIYCFSQKDSECVSLNLQKLGIKAMPYHANMEASDKSSVHRKWTSNQIQIVVATVAFGMGIDKPDVRFVIHHSLSKSMENYYQESGRAGRDDERADCILYYSFGDIFKVSSMVVMENVGQQKLYQMVTYCLDVQRCRRTLIAQHFDEVWDSKQCNEMCDSCHDDATCEAVDVADHGRNLVKILQHTQQIDEKLTPLKLIDSWLGKGAAKNRVSCVAPPKLSRLEMEAVIAYLLVHQYLREDFSFTPYATISYIKLGPKADLLKNEKHTVIMKMRTRCKPSNSEEDLASKPGVEESPSGASNNKPFVKKKRSSKKPKLPPTDVNLSEEKLPEISIIRIAKQENLPNGYMTQSDTEQAAIEVEVQINNEISPLQGKQKISTPKKKKISCQMKDSSHQGKCPPKENLSSTASEASIMSAAAVEELSDLRSYYCKQLQRINYISRENLQDLESHAVRCDKSLLKNFRLGCGPSLARGARSLWTRVSMRRKYFIRK